MLSSDRLDMTFVALADPTRRAILARLALGDASVGELAAPFAMSQPAISKHIKMLERAGLVSRSRDATRRPVHLEAAPMAEAAGFLDEFRRHWEQTYSRLDTLLEELQHQIPPRAAAATDPIERRNLMPKMMPCLWFDDRLEEAVTFYAKVFDGEVRDIIRPGGPGTPPLTARFRLKDQEFLALNYNRNVNFTESISFSVECKDQDEVDRYWNALTADGGEESVCGWLKDKYGLSWQIVPEAVDRTCFGPDPAGAKRATDAMLKMRKLIVADLERAYAGA